MEYEYSFNVTDIKEYIKYCKKNNYNYLGKKYQEITIYRNSNGTIARITSEKGKYFSNKLDFKEDKLSNKDLTIRKESKAIKFINKENCEDILDFLNYKRENTLIRERYVYSNDNVVFEIDNYIEPKAIVIALEGNKLFVDKVYNELENTLNLEFRVKK